MENTLSYIIPIAFGAAISPTLLSVILVLLSNPKTPKAGVFAFLLGSGSVIAIIGVLGIFLSSKAVPQPGGSGSDVSSIIDLFFGVLLLLLGIRKIFSKKNSETKESSIDINKPLKISQYLTLGLIMMTTNFTTLVLYFEILKDLGVAKLGLEQTLVYLLIVIFIIMLPITIPMFFYLAFPKTTSKALLPVNKFIKNHNDTIMITVMFLFAAFLIIKGTG